MKPPEPEQADAAEIALLRAFAAWAMDDMQKTILLSREALTLAQPSPVLQGHTIVSAYILNCDAERKQMNENAAANCTTAADNWITDNFPNNWRELMVFESWRLSFTTDFADKKREKAHIDRILRLVNTHTSKLDPSQLALMLL